MLAIVFFVCFMVSTTSKPSDSPGPTPTVTVTETVPGVSDTEPGVGEEPAVTDTATDPVDPSTAEEPDEETTEPTSEPSSSEGAFYENCDEAKAAGVAPLHAGDPGYSLDLDRDGDGTACETD